MRNRTRFARLGLSHQTIFLLVMATIVLGSLSMAQKSQPNCQFDDRCIEFFRINRFFFVFDHFGFPRT